MATLVITSEQVNGGYRVRIGGVIHRRDYTIRSHLGDGRFVVDDPRGDGIDIVLGDPVPTPAQFEAHRFLTEHAAAIAALPRTCSCGGRLSLFDEVVRQKCSSCFVKSWSPQKRAAFRNLLGVAFDGFDGGRNPGQRDAAIDEAMRHV